MDKKDVKVSVIVPVYNVEKYLVQCIDSIVGQTLRDIEVLCIDDGSLDGSLGILRKYEGKDFRIQVYTKPNSGYGHTINYGLRRCTGKYIVIVESDDFIDEGGIKALYMCAEENKADYVRSNYYRFRDKKDQLSMSLDQYPYQKVLSAHEVPELFYAIPVSPWASIYRRSFLEENKIRMNETPGASFQDNSWQYAVILRAERIVLLQEAFYHYRTDNMNSSMHSPQKAFCVIDEKNYMEQMIAEYQVSDKRSLTAFSRFIYEIYKWNYGRISGEFQYRFLLEWRQEILRQKEKGILDRAVYSQGQWDEVNRILFEMDEYFEETAKVKVDGNGV